MLCEVSELLLPDDGRGRQEVASVAVPVDWQPAPEAHPPVVWQALGVGRGAKYSKTKLKV